jgi:hypothetical protein
VKPITRWHAAIATSGVLFFALACADGATEPNALSPADPTSSVQVASVQGQTPRGFLTASARIAELVPEFAGAYRDAEGKLVVSVTTPIARHRAEAAAAALAAEAGRTEIFAHRLARYTYRDLDRWARTALLSAAQLGATSIAVDEIANAVRLGVGSAAQLQTARSAAVARGIPEDAIVTFIQHPVSNVSSLHSRVRPYRAGYRIVVFYNQPGYGNQEKPCTLGPVVTYQDTLYFLVNSHCTETGTYGQYASGAHVHQPSRNPINASYSRIGVEALDIAWAPISGCPTHGICRYSDAALIRAQSLAEIATIGRTVQRTLLPADSGSLTIDAATPKFALTAVLSSLFVGDTLEKVGMRTGWTAGVVQNTCKNMNLPGTNVWNLCNLEPV